MSMRPDISVVMSVYNGEQYLAETVESILDQEEVEFEFIIVNDGSTDKSGEIIDYYAKHDNRTRVICQENQGLTNALMKGCSEARGLYIARQDVGDISLPCRLKKEAAFLRDNKQVVLVSCGTRFIGPQDEYLYDNIQTNDVTTKRLHPIDINNVKGPSHHGSTMFRKKEYDLAGGYRYYFKMAQDWDLWTRLVEYGEYVALPEVLYQARLMSRSISSVHREQQIKLFKLILECTDRRRKGQKEDAILENVLKLSQSEKKCEYSQLARFYYFIGSCLRSQKSSKAAYYFWKAFKSNPLHLKAAARFIESALERL
jgi:glycosyltransferase involved in cell wall biosynthesis